MIFEFDEEMIKAVNENKLNKYLLNCNFGLEKENIRVNKNGVIAFTPHPKVFGDRLKNPYVKTDFSESQIEMATIVCNSIKEVYSELLKVHNYICTNLNEEYLWPQSNPPVIPDNCEIPIAKMEDYEEEKFRYVLAKKYGKKQQLYCGIHYNFSFKDEFLKGLYDFNNNKNTGFCEFKNNIYLKICRNFIKYRWLLIYLTGASPVFHKSFVKEYVNKAIKLNDESCNFPNMISLRNSDYGYKNKENYMVPYDSVKNYVNYIEGLVSDGRLQSICEFYGPIRLKTGNNDDLSNELLKYGVRYIELRIFDVNPLFKVGISKDDLYIIHLFVLLMLFIKDDELTESDYEKGNKNSQTAAFEGLKNNNIKLQEEGEKIINSINEMIKLLNINDDYIDETIKSALNKINDYEKTYAYIIYKNILDKGYTDFNMRRILS